MFDQVFSVFVLVNIILILKKYPLFLLRLKLKCAVAISSCLHVESDINIILDFKISCMETMQNCDKNVKCRESLENVWKKCEVNGENKCVQTEWYESLKNYN